MIDAVASHFHLAKSLLFERLSTVADLFLFIINCLCAYKNWHHDYYDMFWVSFFFFVDAKFVALYVK